MAIWIVRWYDGTAPRSASFNNWTSAERLRDLIVSNPLSSGYTLIERAA